MRLTLTEMSSHSRKKESCFSNSSCFPAPASRPHADTCINKWKKQKMLCCFSTLNGKLTLLSTEHYSEWLFLHLTTPSLNAWVKLSEKLIQVVQIALTPPRVFGSDDHTDKTKGPKKASARAQELCLSLLHSLSLILVSPHGNLWYIRWRLLSCFLLPILLLWSFCKGGVGDEGFYLMHPPWKELTDSVWKLEANLEEKWMNFCLSNWSRIVRSLPTVKAKVATLLSSLCGDPQSCGTFN